MLPYEIYVTVADGARQGGGPSFLRDRTRNPNSDSRSPTLTPPGVQACKDLFWKSFAWGKKFGQRQTFFDALFMGFRGGPTGTPD